MKREETRDNFTKRKRTRGDLTKRKRTRRDFTKREGPIRFVATIVLGLLFLGAIWTGVFFLTAFFYRSFGLTPSLFLEQIINSYLGLIVFALIILSFAFWVGNRPETRRLRLGIQLGIFEPILAAMRRIAQGDFQFRLDPGEDGYELTSELAKSVNQMAEDLNQIEHMRQEFISIVSHDIQSPLTCIRGFAQALHNEQLSTEERYHYLNIIEMESMRLSRMTDNMLRLASLDAVHVRIEPKPYRLDKQVRTLILACEPLWTEKALEMDVVLEEVEIFADEDLLSQVWNNLLHNSIKFTPAGGQVHIETRQQGTQIECRVTDTGIGIPNEELTRIFERFYKVDKSRERAQEGSGLGLAIAKKIVELHQGTIDVMSQPGNGTTIRVSLPTGSNSPIIC